jgi:ATP-dependent DNA helicase RecQ
VVGIVRKIIQRGAAPPVHPTVEREILQLAGLATEVLESTLPGDMSVELRRPVAFPSDAARASLIRSCEADSELLLDSDEEHTFLSWVETAIGPDAVPWFTPQAPLDRLAHASGVMAEGRMRVDFLVHAPWQPPFIVEVDGAQHDQARSVDEQRDRIRRAQPPTCRARTRLERGGGSCRGFCQTRRSAHRSRARSAAAARKVP